MPLGLCALVAVGVHAAADAVDGHLLWLVDRLSAAWDGLWARWEWTSALVDPVSLEWRTRLAHGLTLAWELAADWVLAAPMLGYREAPAELARPPGAPRLLLRRPADLHATLRKLLQRPTLLRWTRPPFTAAVVLAGACALARMVQGKAFLSLRGGLGHGPAGSVAHLVAVLVLAGAAVSLGWRAVLRALQHADARSDALDPARRAPLRIGLTGALVALPLAVAALVDASPVLSFLRF
jgi:hypothetical protein